MNKYKICIDKEDAKEFYALLVEHNKKEKEEQKNRVNSAAFNKGELTKLIFLSRIIFFELTSIIIVCCFLLSRYESFTPFGICIISGITGSTFAAFLSVLERSSNGWESMDGDKYPKDGPKDKFSKRMFSFFFFRPVFGILAGLLIYFGMQSKTFGKVELNTDNSDIIYFSLVAGFFIKLLMEKLKGLIDSLLK